MAATGRDFDQRYNELPPPGMDGNVEYDNSMIFPDLEVFEMD